MIDLDVAEFHIGVLESAGDKSVPVNVAMMRELITRLRQAEKDAARYRWLRDNCTTQQADTMGPTFVMTIRRNNNLFNVGLSIDEAMQCNK